jgi:hypothetical protein
MVNHFHTTLGPNFKTLPKNGVLNHARIKDFPAKARYSPKEGSTKSPTFRSTTQSSKHGSKPEACSTIAASIGFSAALLVVETVGTQPPLVFYNSFPNRSRVKHISSSTTGPQGKLGEYLLSKRAFGTKNSFIDTPSFET